MNAKTFVITTIGALVVVACSAVNAAEPRPEPSVIGIVEPSPVPWPCLAEGWAPGDQWGPGPFDIVPDAPPCPVEPVPEPSGMELGIDSMTIELPATDTAP